MYESEANSTAGQANEIPSAVLKQFGEMRKQVTARSLIPWGEHCTECAWPTCFQTCELYVARPDGRCRRFLDGMIRLPHPDALASYILKITFKRWAKLWSFASLSVRPLSDADRAERKDLFIASSIQTIPLDAVRQTITRKRYSWKKRRALRGAGAETKPTQFLIECFNPNRETVSLTLTISREGDRQQFQHLFVMEPGFNRHTVAVDAIERLVTLSTPFSIDLTPNEVAEGLTLYFGAIDFVAVASDARGRAAASAPDQIAPCKCVVFDLDNTLWDGTLVEDGADRLSLKPGMVELLKELDARGILLSIASKNSHDDAIAVLRKFQIDEYFLFPQISWNPKGRAVQEIAKRLNIGMSSILFVDDSTFEREEVKSVCPEVMVLDAAEYRHVTDRPDCRLPATDEAKGRRALYREQAVREDASHEFQGDYFAFLRACHLELVLNPLTPSNLERVHELTQRTNQMNFSGNRYTRAQLQEMMMREDLDTFVLDCRDKFGVYGTIGFCIVERVEPRMIDLMFSCRVQSKRVEHAFMSYIVREYRRLGGGTFFVNYRRTKKNAPSGQVFADLGAESVGEADGVSQLAFLDTAKLGDEGIVTIEDRGTIAGHSVTQHG